MYSVLSVRQCFVLTCEILQTFIIRLHESNRTSGKKIQACTSGDLFFNFILNNNQYIFISVNGIKTVNTVQRDVFTTVWSMV